MKRLARLPTIAPTLLDRVIGYVDPVRGARRAHARGVMALHSAYTGARRDRRSMQEWSTLGGSADSDTLPDLPMLRDRSRDLVRNAPLAGGAINTVVTNVVGTGIRPQALIDRSILGLTDQEADDWQDAAEWEWHLWAENQECDARRTLDFYSMQDLVFRSVLESGDTFVLKRWIERPGCPYGLKLQLVESDRISNPSFRPDRTRLENGRLVAGGVELDRNGAPVAYYVLRQHPGDPMLGPVREWDRLPAFGERTGERQVMHLYRMLRPDQVRGVPYLAPVIEPLKQLDRYSEAEIMAAVISAMFTVFVKTESGGGLSPATPTAKTGGTAADEDYKLAPGAILDLLPGESIDPANPMRPNANFDPFVQSIYGQIGTLLEIPSEVLLKHYTASYSASRAAMVDAWKFFRMRRRWLAQNFCQPVYEALITEAVATERLSAPGFFEDPLIRRAWLATEWTGPPPGHVDPESEANAAEKWVNLGVMTLQEVTAEHTGGDWETKLRQRAKERRLRDAAGLTTEEIGNKVTRVDDTTPERKSPSQLEREKALMT